MAREPLTARELILEVLRATFAPPTRERALELLRATFASSTLSTWLPTTGTKRLVWAIRCAIVLATVVLIASAVDKSLWNWLKLLVVPAVLAFGGYWLNRQQQARQYTVEERRAQDQALQSYLDQMSQMLADKERPLHKAQRGDSLSTVARARTLTVLERLDEGNQKAGNHKARVAQFLYESDLIMKNHSIINLRGANFDGANLAEANLSGANFDGATFNGAKLDSANLNGATLEEAIFEGSSLFFTDLEGADLRSARLKSVDHLRTALLSEATNLDGARISGVGPPELDNLTPEQKNQVLFIYV